MQGFIKLNRDIQDTWIYKDDRYFKAWCTILLNVNWKPANVVIGSKTLFCDVNEALFSLDTWAKKFGKSWNKDKVRRFFNRLETHHYISTKSATKTTRLKVLVSSDCEDEPHDKDTNTDTKGARTPHPIEEVRSKNKEEEDSFDKRVNKNLPFDVVTSSQTITALFQDTTEAIELVRNTFQIEATDQDVKKAMHTFSTVAVASYDKYRGIRTLEKLKNKFIDWIPKSIKYEATQKGKSDNNESHDLETYLAENMHPVELRKMKESGKLDQLKEKLKENQFKLSNIAKAYKNEMITTLFLFEALFLPLGNRLGGSNDKRKLESFQKWVKTLSDYNQNKGDIRQLLKDRNKNLV